MPHMLHMLHLPHMLHIPHVPHIPEIPQKPHMQNGAGDVLEIDVRLHGSERGPEDPWDLGNWLPDELARGMGLMTGLKSHVVLYLNKKSKGVYVRSLRPAERLALENGRLPGNWIKGDRNKWERASVYNCISEPNETLDTNISTS